MKIILSILIVMCPYLLMAQNGQYQNLIVTDKLGVGTTNPTHDFHLLGDARIDGNLHIMKGVGNVHLGLQAGGTSAQAKNNTAVGVSSLEANIAGNNNTAIGKDALLANEVGSDNVALGMQSLYSNQLGSENTAIGTQSLYSNEEGHSNIGIGKAALYKNVDGNKNIGIGNNAQQNLKNGNDNIAIGDKTLELNSRGNRNIAIGTEALQENNDINDIIAIGHGALTKNGTNRVANTIEGWHNLGIGSFALHHNTTGRYNLGIGSYAMRVNTIGERNIAIGAASLYNNTEGFGNLAIGLGALYDNTFGYSNIGIGQSTLSWNTIGSNNVAIGIFALIENTIGNYNVAIGQTTLSDNRTGKANTALGTFAHKNAMNYDNSMGLGYNAQVHGDNSIYLGDGYIESIDAIVGWGTMSDQRLKKNIKQNVPGLEFIQELNPVTYQMDMEAVVAWNNTPDSIRDVSSEIAKGNIRYTGFIAQEVEAAAEALDFDFSGVDKPYDETDRYSLRYAEFVVPLVKAVQELDEQNAALQSTNEALHERVVQLEVAMQQLLAHTTEERTATQVESITQAQLFQNQPNPLHEQTTIPYYIPERIQEALLQITDTNGRLLKQIPITARGKGQVELHLHNLSNGTYYYTLLLDGTISDTKQMLVQTQ